MGEIDLDAADSRTLLICIISELQRLNDNFDLLFEQMDDGKPDAPRTLND